MSAQGKLALMVMLVVAIAAVSAIILHAGQGRRANMEHKASPASMTPIKPKGNEAAASPSGEERCTEGTLR